MSRLAESIKEKCPNGVKFVKLQEVAKIVRGERVTKKDLIFDGIYPVVSGGTSPLGRLNQKNRDKDTITVASYGTAGYVNWQEEDFWANDVCLCTYPKSELSNRFLYFYLKSQQQYLYSKTTKAIPDHIPTEVIKELRIPVPPLEVQNEIVQILDNFAELTAELTAELSNRKKQYEYYRDLLLNFDENEWREGGIKWVSLGDVARRLRGSAVTAGQMKNMIIEGGSIRIFAGGQTMIDTDESFTNHLNVLNIPAVIVKSRGLIDVEYYDKPFTFKQEMWAYTGNAEISTKYIYYILKTKLGILRAKGGKMGSMPQIKLEDTDKLTIPVPSIDTQEKIVKILDRFDKLTSDISEGLPAEIEARGKQYAYYRDKLLSFKELETEMKNA